jgi:tetratricopeptide (TPR) repeat protein
MGNDQPFIAPTHPSIPSQEGARLTSPPAEGCRGGLFPAILFILCLFVLSGCKSVQSVRTESSRPLMLTAAETDKARTEGLALWAQQPRDLARVTEAAHQLELAARALRDDYVAQCDAAQALAFVSENDVNTNVRRDAAKNGVVLARRASELKPDGVEGHYWYAIDVGLLADADRLYGLKAVGEMKEALERAIELDERYDYAGPLRVLGILYLRTPPPPVSIGSPRKGLKLLQRAVELFPDYPENYLYLGEALRDVGRVGEARVALRKVLNASPWPDRQFESGQWKTQAQKLLQTL